MVQYTIGVEGMACSMCEAHINDAIRRALPVKKVTSSHSKRQTIVVSEVELEESALRAAIDAAGYHALSIQSAPYHKRGLFSFHK